MAPPAPRRFGQYELLERLGRGGMGETWKARRLGVANAPIVVIKRILPEHARNPDFVDSFVTEAHVTASLLHEAIAHVLDFGTVEGEYFFAVEYVEGKTVADLLDAAARKGLPTLPVPIACFITIEILKGLQYAHGRARADGQPLSLVHRDISPDNLLVGFDGQLKLVDFGVAKSKLQGRSETQVGLVKGKWPYFSPEQATAQPLDARSDLWAMGVVLYRMVCGRQPFDGEWVSAARKIVRGEYVAPASLNPRLPEPVVEVIEHALQVNRDRRFGSADAMAKGLSQTLSTLPQPFARAQFRAFVLWAFDDPKPVDPAARRQIQRWVAEAAGNVPSSPGELPHSALKQTAMQLAPVVPERKRRPLLVAGLALFAGGAICAGALVLALRTDNQPAPVASAIDPRAQAFARVAVAFRALEQTRPDAAADARARYLELSKQASAAEGAQADGKYVQACAAFEAMLRNDAQAALEPAPVDAGVAPEPVAGPPPPAVDTLTWDGRRALRLSLNLARHNLGPLLAQLEAPQLLSFERATETMLVNYSHTAFAVSTEPLPGRGGAQLVVVGHGSKNPNRHASAVRFVDFQPFTRRRDDVPISFGSAFVDPGKTTGGLTLPSSGLEKKAPVVPLVAGDGHALVLEGLTAAQRVSFRLHRASDVAVVVNCGATTEPLTTTPVVLPGVAACALSAVSLATSGSVEVDVELEPNEGAFGFDTVLLDLSAPRKVSLDFAHHNLASAAKVFSPLSRWRGKVPEPIKFNLVSPGPGVFAQVATQKPGADKKALLVVDPSHPQSFEDVLEIRLVDFRPLEVIDARAPLPEATLHEAMVEERSLPVARMDRTQGHFVELEGVAGYRSLEVARPPGLKESGWGMVAHCDGRTLPVRDKPVRFDNPGRCALALLGTSDSHGTQDVVVTARGPRKP